MCVCVSAVTCVYVSTHTDLQIDIYIYIYCYSTAVTVLPAFRQDPDGSTVICNTSGWLIRKDSDVTVPVVRSSAQWNPAKVFG